MVRNRALKSASWQCQRCPSKRNLHVHHLSYERLGAEFDRDVEVLCENCHRDEHLEQPDQTSVGVYLRLASSLIGSRPYVSISDLADDMRCECLRLKMPLQIDRINDAIAIVCGNRLTSRAQAAHELKYAHIPVDSRPISHPEAREFIGLLGIGDVVDAVAKTMPSHRARDTRTHAQALAEQVAEFHASERRPQERRRPLRERLEAIFSESPV